MKHFKPLLSSAPSHSILNAQAFHYTNSTDTDIRKTFARIRREHAKAAVVARMVNNVRPLGTRPGDAQPQARAPQAAAA